MHLGAAGNFDGTSQTACGWMIFLSDLDFSLIFWAESLEELQKGGTGGTDDSRLAYHPSVGSSEESFLGDRRVSPRHAGTWDRG